MIDFRHGDQGPTRPTDRCPSQNYLLPQTPHAILPRSRLFSICPASPITRLRPESLATLRRLRRAFDSVCLVSPELPALCEGSLCEGSLWEGRRTRDGPRFEENRGCLDPPTKHVVRVRIHPDRERSENTEGPPSRSLERELRGFRTDTHRGCTETSKNSHKYWTSRPGWDRDALERDRRERALTPAPLRAPSGVYPSYPHGARRNRPARAARAARRSRRGRSLSARALSARRCADCSPIPHPECQQVPSSPISSHRASPARTEVALFTFFLRHCCAL
jgi:hypothetical protein